MNNENSVDYIHILS